jgi:hypothetical protein
MGRDRAAQLIPARRRHLAGGPARITPPLHRGPCWGPLSVACYLALPWLDLSLDWYRVCATGCVIAAQPAVKATVVGGRRLRSGSRFRHHRGLSGGPQVERPPSGCPLRRGADPLCQSRPYGQGSRRPADPRKTAAPGRGTRPDRAALAPWTLLGSPECGLLSGSALAGPFS